MAEDRVQRKPTTIFVAEVDGLSRLLAGDEIAARRTLKTYREIIDRLIARHQGRIIGTSCDGVLAEFISAVDAVRCAISIQEDLRVRKAELSEDHSIGFRIGINVGDGIDVASRLGGLAGAGGVCISGSTFNLIKNTLSIGFEDLGAQEFKSISEPIRAFRTVPGPVAARGKPAAAKLRHVLAIAATGLFIIVTGGVAWHQPWVTPVEPAAIERMKFPLPDRQSIVVLPFDNLSMDPEHGRLADGVTEDIITKFASVSGLFVIGQQSTFSYKRRPVNAHRVAEDLGVRHVVTGSVRRVDDTLRVTAQLIDAVSGQRIWAERYDRTVSDVFAIQNEIAAAVTAELSVTLKASERDRLLRLHTDNLDAYDAFLRARRFSYPGRDANRRAEWRSLLESVIALDPKFAAGYGLLAWTYLEDVHTGHSASPEEDLERALTLGRKAVATDDTYARSFLALGFAHLMKHQYDKAIAAAREAVRLEPSGSVVYAALGHFLYWAGRGDEAIEALKTAARSDPMRNMAWLGSAYVTAGRYRDAIATLEREYERNARPGSNAFSFLAAAYVATGQNEKARAVMKAFLDNNPGTTLSNYHNPSLYKRTADRNRYLNLLRKAGMPE